MSLQLPTYTVRLPPRVRSSSVPHPDPTPVTEQRDSRTPLPLPLHTLLRDHCTAVRALSPSRAGVWAVASGRKRLAATDDSPVPRDVRYRCCRLAWRKQRLRQRPYRLGLRSRADRCVLCCRYLLPFYPSASGGRPSMPRAEHAHSRRPLTRSYPLISRRMGSCWDE